MISVNVKETEIMGLTEYPITSGSVGLRVQFNFEGVWSTLTKVAVFSCGEITRDVYLDDSSTCDLPWEILTTENIGKPVCVGAYGTFDNKIVIPTICTEVGILQEGTDLSTIPSLEPTPGLVETLIAKTEEAISTADSVRQDADNGVFIGDTGNGIDSIVKTASEGLIDTYTITYTDSTTTTFTVTNGEQGPQGIQGIPGNDGHTPIITIKDGYWFIDGVNTQQLAQGVKGATGNGISAIDKTKTEGLVDTYTITYTDGNTNTFTVTNGEQGIQGIQGEKGEQGIQGIQGEKGEQGIQGIQGEKGNDGHTPVITIDSDGNWCVDGISTEIKAQGVKGDKGDTGLQGPKGDKGDKGDTGSGEFFVVTDTTNNINYNASIKLINGKPIIEYEEV